MIIKIFPNHCKVEGENTDLQWIRSLLTIEVPGAKYTQFYRMKRWDGKKRFFSLVSKTFPIGFLHYVLSNKGSCAITLEDFRKFEPYDSSLPKLNLGLRDYQKKAILDCLKYRNCIVQAATNAGKTAIFAGVIKKLYPLPTLILTHRSEILWQMKKMIEDYTGLEVGVIIANDILLKPVTIAMVTTLNNRLGAVQEITDFFESVGCIVADECHHAVSRTFTALLSSSNAVYRFGFSGTVPEEDTFPGMLVRQWIGSVAFRISNEDLIESGVSAKPTIYVYEMDLTSCLHGIFEQAKEELIEVFGDYTGQQLLKKVYQLSVQKGIVENSERNLKILEIVNDNKGKSVLVVVDFLQHGEILKKLLKDNGITAEFISGASDVRKLALEEFKKGKLKILISTNIIDEGIDISRIEVLAMFAGKKSKRQLLQRVGRSLRKKEGENTVKIYDFVDYGSRYLERHSKLRLAIYKNENFDVKFV